MNGDKNNKQNPRKVFWQCGTCSRAVFHILNTEFNNPKEIEERAADPLAGGIYQKGEQCGMLWGGALGIGTESFRKYGNSDKAVATAIKSTGLLINSFVKRTKSVNCLEITNCDFSNKFDFAKFMLKTILCGFIYSPCFNLINKWAPEAIVLVKDGLLDKNINLLEPPISCASEVAKKMGASDEEIIMVAGFAGGLGLSGNGCGALSAAIWINRLQWCKKNSGTHPYLNNQNIKEIFEVFYRETNSEIVCSKICGRNFKTIDEHTEYIKNGGCKKLIETLSGI